MAKNTKKTKAEAEVAEEPVQAAPAEVAAEPVQAAPAKKPKHKKIPNGKGKLLLIIGLILIAAFVFLIMELNANGVMLEDTGTYSNYEPVEVFDYTKIEKLHKADDVVLTAGGSEVTWDEYLYYFEEAASNLESYMGSDIPFDEKISSDADAVTYAEYPGWYAESLLQYYLGTEKLAEDKNIKMSDATKQEVQDSIDYYIASYGLTSEDELYKYLYKTYGVPEKVARRDMYLDPFVSQMLSDIYGENGSKISDDEALKYLEDQGYVHVKHILFSSFDMTTYQELDDAAKEAKKAQAEEVLKELTAIEDNEERLAKFDELAAKYNEDNGCEYTFKEGTMVEQFEAAAKSIQDYEVILADTAYGYHVIIRLPLNPNTELQETYQTPKLTIAQNDMTDLLMEYKDKMTIKYADGFTTPNIKDYIK